MIVLGHGGHFVHLNVTVLLVMHMASAVAYSVMAGLGPVGCHL